MRSLLRPEPTVKLLLFMINSRPSSGPLTTSSLHFCTRIRFLSSRLVIMRVGAAPELLFILSAMMLSLVDVYFMTQWA